MEELTICSRHWLVPHPHLIRALGKDTELAFLRLSPGEVFLEQLQGSVRIRYVVVGVRRGVDVEGGCETSVTLQPEAFIIAFDFWPCGSWVRAAGKTFDFLLPPTTRAANYRFRTAGRGLIAG